MIVKKSLSTGTHICQGGGKIDCDENVARKILNQGLGTVGHKGTFAQENENNASKEMSSTFLVGEIRLGASKFLARIIPSANQPQRVSIRYVGDNITQV